MNRLTNMVDAVGSSSFSYDAAGQMLTENGPWASDTVSRTHANRLRASLSMQQPSASDWTVGYGWDATRRLTNVTSAAGSVAYSYGVSQPTLINKVTLPQGHYRTNSYDALSRLEATTLMSVGGVLLNEHVYSLNVGNQRTQVRRTGPGYTNTVDYGYDPAGQLLTAVGQELGGAPRLQEQLGYAYDAGGNLRTRTNNALVQTFGVDALNQLTNVSRAGTLTVAGTTTSAATNVTVNSLTADRYADHTFAKAGFTVTNGWNTFTAIAKDSYGRTDSSTISVDLPVSVGLLYDLNGNLRYDGRRTFEYDDENQLVSVLVTNAWKSEFAYDGKMRRRVRKEYTWTGSAWSLTNEVRYIYDGMLVIQERDGSNLPRVTYTRGLDLSGTFEGAGGIGGLLARTDAAQASSLLRTAFYHADGNGNITALASTNGLVLARYHYDPYGNTLAASGPLAEANVYRFSSKEWHANAGLSYYGYRFYEPNLQRWLNRDPVGEAGGLNLFQAFNNAPPYLVDSDGRIVLPIIGIVAFAIAAYSYVAVMDAHLEHEKLIVQIQNERVQRGDLGSLGTVGQPYVVDCIKDIPSIAQGLASLGSPAAGALPAGPMLAPEDAVVTIGNLALDPEGTWSGLKSTWEWVSSPWKGMKQQAAKPVNPIIYIGPKIPDSEIPKHNQYGEDINGTNQ